MYNPKHKKLEYETNFSYYDIKFLFDNILSSMDENDYFYLPYFFFYDLKKSIYNSNTRIKELLENED